jgi:hypothetical protein
MDRLAGWLNEWEGDVLHSTADVYEGERINLVVKFNWVTVNTQPFQPFHCWNKVRRLITYPLLPSASSYSCMLMLSYLCL